MMFSLCRLELVPNFEIVVTSILISRPTVFDTDEKYALSKVSRLIIRSRRVAKSRTYSFFGKIRVNGWCVWMVCECTIWCGKPAVIIFGNIQVNTLPEDVVGIQ